jgi:hypothetical protein
MPVGTGVFAVSEGTIHHFSKTDNSDWGIYVIVRHELTDGSVYSCYAHLDELFDFQIGQSVSRGTPLGKSGSSGSSTGPHLHFQIDKDGGDDHSFQYPYWKCGPPVDDPPEDGCVDDWTYSPITFIRDRESALMASSGLEVAQTPPYSLGQTITARFSVKNISSSALDVTTLAATGRGPGGDADTQDFEHDNSVGTLDPNEVRQYQGNLTLTKVGFYTFEASALRQGVWSPVAGSGQLRIEVLPPRANLWLRSDNLANCTGPAAGGFAWHDPGFDDQNWTALPQLPDQNWGCTNCDRYYRFFYYWDPSIRDVSFSFDTDDGIWLYANSQLVGNWGAGCHGSCCINNVPYFCACRNSVQPANITQWLHEGYNLIAVHVTQGGGSQYFSGIFSPPPTAKAVVCANSQGPGLFVSCPAGDVFYKSVLRDADQVPISGSSDVWLDFTGWSDVSKCGTQSGWPRLDPVSPSNTAGEAFFVLRGGKSFSGDFTLKSSQGTIRSQGKVSSLDADGDLVVTSADWTASGGMDLNDDGIVNALDFELFRAHLGHNCVSTLPIRFERSLASDPPSGDLVPGQQARITLTVKNSNGSRCDLDSARFNYSGFNIAYRDWTQFSFQEGAWPLSPQQELTLDAQFTVPLDGFHGCIEAWFWTSCSPDSFRTQLNLNVSRRSSVHASDCSAEIGDGYGFPVTVEATPILPPGWSYTVSQTSFFAPGVLSLSIVPPTWTAYGQTGSVTAVGYGPTGAEVGAVTCELTVNRIPGDMNDDHVADILDVELVIDCAFRDGACPRQVGCRYDLMDTDCSGLTDILDVTRMINVIFREQSPSTVFCDPCL